MLTSEKVMTRVRRSYGMTVRQSACIRAGHAVLAGRRRVTRGRFCHVYESKSNRCHEGEPQKR